MDMLYPAGPTDVPAELVAPSARYRRQAWLAVGGLVAFVGLYFATLCWFAWTSFRLFGVLFQGDAPAFTAALGAICALFLAIFMAIGLFVGGGRKARYDGRQLTPAEQPELFAFLHRLADEAGAPRPHKVFLSERVNAAVFYDVSLFNLLVPSKKNLEIGLGLVNILNLGEFKAVLSHEFGHFAQRSMAVGRWVYVAHQIAARIVSHRGTLDDLLRGLSSVDYRIAWIGWLLSLVVWSIRSLVEILFRVVVLSERALSREMEYQADLVAASLTGSDALVHALHRLGAADDAWARTLSFASNEAQDKRPVRDLFAVQARLIELTQRVYADPTYGASPPLPADARDTHRVFRAQLAQPPQMWSTHPANTDREANIKRTYIAAAIDPRPATTLFRDVDALKVELSERLLGDSEATFVPIEETLARLDEAFARRSMDRRYRGTYLNRSFVRDTRTPRDLYVAPDVGTLSDDALAVRIAGLYPESHGDVLERVRELQSERDTLEATRLGHLKAAGGVVHWRGERLSRKQLVKAIAGLDREIAEANTAAAAHDCECRTVHVEAGKRVGMGWDELLRGEVTLIHYAEHVDADLHDLLRVFANTFNVITADGKVSEGEVKRLLNDGARLHAGLEAVFEAGQHIVLDDEVARRLGQSWKDVLGPLSLPRPTRSDLGQWPRAAEQWVNATRACLSRLRSAALEALLEHEDRVATMLRDGRRADAPSASWCPDGYPVRLKGEERPLVSKLSVWDRFQMADGVFAMIGRTAAAACIVGAIYWLGASLGVAKFTVYNGLTIPVVVDVGGTTNTVAPMRSATLEFDTGKALDIEARTQQGERIEAFRSEPVSGGKHVVYNIAQAASLVQWTAHYGTPGGENHRPQGAPRWSTTTADYLFEEPPKQIQSKYGTSRSVLSASSNEPASGILQTVSSSEEAQAMVDAHARWDAPDSPQLSDWFVAGMDRPAALKTILAQRLASHPDDIAALRAEQYLSEETAPAELAAICARHTATADAAPQAAGLQYAKARCIPEGEAQDRAFAELLQRFPTNAWVAYANAFTLSNHGRWAEAEPLYLLAAKAPQTASSALSELLRVRRMNGTLLTTDSASLVAGSEFESMLAAESTATAVGTPMEPYAHLSRGSLKLAEDSLARVDDDHARNRIRWLIAASDGAGARELDEARSHGTDEGVDLSNVWAAWALARREGFDETPFRKRVEIAAQGRQVVAFFEALTHGANREDAERALGQVTPGLRGHAYEMATIYLGARTPAEWREGAKRLLFAPERPYFN